jgi:phenylacetate-CoA ligase
MAHALPAPVVPGTVAHRHLGRTLWHAFNEVPAYHALWRSAGLDPAALELPAEMGRLPIITRRDLLRFPPAERCRPGLHSDLQMEHSRGTTGAPFDVPLDRATRRRRQRRFFKALVNCGYRPGQRLLLLSKRAGCGPARFVNWRYACVTLDDAALASAYRELRPAVLYGPLDTLLRLGARLVAEQVDWPRPQLLISTGDELTPDARQRLVELFGVEPGDFYGLAETGLLAWRKPGRRKYRLATCDYLFEFLPSAIYRGLERLVVTDLARPAMPLVRFDTGDLVLRDPADDEVVLGVMRHQANGDSPRFSTSR